MSLPDTVLDFDGLYDSEWLTFDMYFSSVCTMRYHPGSGTKDHSTLTIEECREEAMKMIKARRRIDGRI